MVAVHHFVVLLSCIQLDSVVTGISDMSGQQFVLAFPTPARDDRHVHFLLYTPEVLVNVTVKLTTMWSTVESIPSRTVMVNRDVMERVTIEEKFSLLSKTEEDVEFGTGKYLFVLAHTDVSEKFTYVLKGDGRFCVTVIIEDSTSIKKSMAALLAVPVEGWGKFYFAVTLAYQPSIQIVTALENTVTIIIRSPREKFLVKYNEMYYNNGGYMLLNLPAYKGFSLQACPNSKHNYGVLTGTTIEGRNPIGVISGNCEAYDDDRKCSPSDKNQAPISDMVMEMLLPRETMGDSFILYGIQAEQRIGYYIVVASQDETTTKYQDDSRINQDKINKSGEHLVITGSNKAALLTTSQPVTVVFIHQTKCNYAVNSGDPGDGAITVVIPIGLFMDLYVWLTPDISYITGMPVNHYLSFVCQQTDVEKTLLLDNVLMQEYHHTVSTLNLSTIWLAGEVEIRVGQHDLYSSISTKLGAYLYGIGKSYAYMYPAGFVSSPIADKLACTQMTSKVMVRGDLIDNDCDGLVDEEKSNNVDDDNDGKMDEDLMAMPPRNGSWGEWNPWWCSNCNSTLKIRTRQCNTPFPIRGGHNCIGIRTEAIASQCFDICKTVHGAWGEWQQWACTIDCGSSVRIRNCDNPAPKFNGLNCTGSDSQSKADESCPAKCPKGWTTTTPPDTTEAEPHGGSWGIWTDWSCPSNCHEKQMQRERSCDSPPPDPGGLECLGPPFQRTEDELCNAVCADDCPDGMWGLNCTNNCAHCENPCDKNTGVCESCKPGYQFPKKSCYKECDSFFHGYDCRGNCILDCAGQDCIDKAKGTCPAPRRKINYMYLLFLLMLIPMAILCYLPHRHNQREIPELDMENEYTELAASADGPLLKAVSSKPSQSGTELKSTASRTSKTSKQVTADLTTFSEWL